MKGLRKRALTKEEQAELKRLESLNEDKLTKSQIERYDALIQKMDHVLQRDKEMHRRNAKSYRKERYPDGYLVAKLNGRLESPDTHIKYFHHVSPATSPRKSPKSPARAASPAHSPTRRATSPHRSKIAHGGKRTRRSTRK